MFKWKKVLSDGLLAVIIGIGGFFIYANSLFNKFLWDDYGFFLNNEFVHNWHFWHYYFTQNILAGAGKIDNYWRPILLVVFSIEWHLWHNWVIGYHLVNTAFHITDAVLLFYILIMLFGNRTIALLTALVFLVHPVQTEAVVYINSLGDSLSVFFILLGIWAYLKSWITKTKKYYVFALIFYILGIMSKETAIVLSALLFLIDFLFLTDLDFWQRVYTSLKRTLPFWGITGTYLILRATILNFQSSFNFYSNTQYGSNIGIRLLTFFRVLVIDFRLMLAPITLIYERSALVATNLWHWDILLGALIFVGSLVIALIYYKKYPMVTFGIMWFYITLAPTSNVLVPINGILYEHWLYLPLVGFFLTVIWLIRSNKTLVTVFSLFLIVLGIRTMIRNRDWREPITFYTKTLTYSPNDPRLLENAAIEYQNLKKYPQAIEMFKKAIELDPTNAGYVFNLGNAYAQIKDPAAINFYNKTLILDPGYTLAYQALYGLYNQNKDYTNEQLILKAWIAHAPARMEATTNGEFTGYLNTDQIKEILLKLLNETYQHLNPK